MATIGSTFLDLIDLNKRQDDNRQIATVIEMLKQNNAVLDDAMAVECNSGTKHTTTIRTGLPAVTWGQFFVYQGFNEKTGWMHTSTYTDIKDEFVENITKTDKI